ncbi:unnamed protein product [Peniophora sp. CBMAI 1063]|nr:unnamed protein product [Peniophora sp. CBMAI 1063]
MDLQVVVNAVTYVITPEDAPVPLWRDIRMIPVYVAAVSMVIAVLSSISRALHSTLSEVTHPHQQNITPKSLRAHILSLGGIRIYAFRVARTISIFALLFLYAYEFVRDVKSRDHPGHMAKDEILGLVLFLTYLYASGLALLNIVAEAPLARTAAPHLVLILLASSAVYGFRDIWPLMTYTLRPVDAQAGALLWVKIALLAVAGIVIPLIVPRQYVPVDPENPSAEPNPEQTCSLLSLLTYSFLDKPIFTVYHNPQLASETLPEIADYDRTAHLVDRSFKHLDVFSGAPRQHMFFALMRIFRVEYIILSLLMIVRACTSLFAPVGINRLLAYLESGGEGAMVRPWVWCLFMFLGPFVGTVTMQYYTFTTTGTMVRAEGIITQLVFEHALRLRVKSETASTPPPSATQTPETASIVETDSGTVVGEGSESGTSHQGEASSSTAVSSTSQSSNKDLGKVSDQKDNAGKEKEKEKEKGDNFVGKINNLVTTDLQSIVNGRDFTMAVVFTPVTIGISLYFLYLVLGWSAFVGMGVMVACLPIPAYLVKKLQEVQKTLMKKTDARVQAATEMMGVLRMIKMFGWEGKIAERLSVKRIDELRWLRTSEMIDLGNDGVTLFMPVFQMLATYGTFTLVMGGRLTPSIVFPSMSVFMLLRNHMSMFFYFASPIIKAKVSLDRATEFLRETELLDRYAQIRDKPTSDDLLLGQPADSAVVGMCDASFTWAAASSSSDGTQTPSRRTFTLRVPGELILERGKINIIVGPTGSGKTSLLMALLGEMHFSPLVGGAWVNLPRTRGIAYAAQESWVQNETIRDNILFGAPYEEVRYKKVIHQCGLKRDLSLFEAGDNTEVGEKGLTLSGGQKARVTLARAIYSFADVLLLDDVLAALDVHTAKWIVDKCFKGDLVRGRTVLLVTHNVALAGTIADYVVSLGSDGAIAARGSYKEVLAKDKELADEVAQETEILAKVDEEIEEPEDLDDPATAKTDGKLIVKEEVAEGHVSLHALNLFWAALGGKHPVLFWLSFFVFIFGYHILASSQSFWLGRWADAYSRPGEVDVIYYMANFVLLVACTTVSYLIYSATYVFGILRAAKKIHALLIDSILGTTLRWLDQTPVSRVITRCTKDIKAIDGQFAGEFRWLMSVTAQLITQLVAIALITPAVVFPGIAVFCVGAWFGNIYMKAQLPVKREMSNKKAPVLGHFGAAMTGLTSIRAYGAEAAFRKESYKRIENYTRSGRMYYNLNRWISTRSDALAALFPSGLGVYMVYGPGAAAIGASNVGFSLAMAAAFSNMILWWVRVFNDFEVEGNSLERIQAYLEIEQEPKPVKEKVPPASWPTSGELRVEGLSARYSPEGPKVLHDISFTVQSGERVGIVGRTGSGKSSLTLSLLRCIYTDGDVYYDGVNTANLNLDVLRTNVTIIPQVPELLSGTLRENLDPFSEHDDAVLNSALRASGLFSLQSETDEGRITLDSQISSGGGNLSVGQRQILALARALVRGSKLLILDEATSSIDYETDTIIQSSLRNELGGDVTLLTVAHRLQTIMDADKIMVLDAGRIVEYDSPKVLLKKEGGFLKSLVDESGDKDALYAMAGGVVDAN